MKKTISALFLLCAVLVCFFSRDAQAFEIGPTDQSLSSLPTTNFIGYDGRTLCKACEIPCASTLMFKNCQYDYYRYGCHLSTPCVTVNTANKFQILAAVSFCLTFNKCEFQDFITSPSEFVLFDPSKQVEDVLEEAVRSQTSQTLQSTMNSYLDYLSAKVKDIEYQCNNRIRQNSMFDRLFALSKDLCAKLIGRVNSIKEYITTKGNTITINSMFSRQLQIIKSTSRLEYGRLLRDAMLNEMNPQLPGAFYIYFMYSTNFKTSKRAPEEYELKELNRRLPSWFKNMISYHDLDEFDFDGLKQQSMVGGGNSQRMDKLMEWIMLFSETNGAKYYDIHSRLVEANSKLPDNLMNIYQTEKVTASVEEKQKNPALILATQSEFTTLAARNNLFSQEQQLFIEMNAAYNSLLTQFANEVGLSIEAGMFTVLENSKNIFFGRPVSQAVTGSSFMLEGWNVNYGTAFSGFGAPPTSADVLTQQSFRVTTKSTTSSSPFISFVTSVTQDQDEFKCGDRFLVACQENGYYGTFDKQTGKVTCQPSQSRSQIFEFFCFDGSNGLTVTPALTDFNIQIKSVDDDISTREIQIPGKLIYKNGWDYDRNAPATNNQEIKLGFKKANLVRVGRLFENIDMDDAAVRCGDNVLIANQQNEFGVLFLASRNSAVFMEPDGEYQSYTITGCIGKEAIQYGQKISLLSENGRYLTVMADYIYFSDKLTSNSKFSFQSAVNNQFYGQSVMYPAMVYLATVDKGEPVYKVDNKPFAVIVVKNAKSVRKDLSTIKCGDFVMLQYIKDENNNYRESLSGTNYVQLKPMQDFTLMFKLAGTCAPGQPVTSNSVFQLITPSQNTLYFDTTTRALNADQFLDRSKRLPEGAKARFLQQSSSKLKYDVHTELMLNTNWCVNPEMQPSAGMGCTGYKFRIRYVDLFAYYSIMRDASLACGDKIRLAGYLGRYIIPSEANIAKVTDGVSSDDPRAIYTIECTPVNANIISVSSFKLKTSTGSYLYMQDAMTPYMKTDGQQNTKGVQFVKSKDVQGKVGAFKRLGASFYEYIFQYNERTSNYRNDVQLPMDAVISRHQAGSPNPIRLEKVVTKVSEVDVTKPVEDITLSIKCGSTITLKSADNLYLTSTATGPKFEELKNAASLSAKSNPQYWKVNQDGCSSQQQGVIRPELPITLTSRDNKVLKVVTAEKLTIHNLSQNAKFMQDQDLIALTVEGKLDQVVSVNETTKELSLVNILEITERESLEVGLTGVNWCGMVARNNIKLTTGFNNKSKIYLTVDTSHVAWVNINRFDGQSIKMTVNCCGVKRFDITQYLSTLKWVQVEVYNAYKCHNGNLRAGFTIMEEK